MKLYIALFMSLLVTMTSCDDWLDVKPASKIEKDDLYETPEGFIDAAVGVYSLMASDNLYTNNLSLGVLEILGRNYGPSGATEQRLQSFYGYNYETIEAKATIKEIWGGLYSAIANCNMILEEAEKQQSSLDSMTYKYSVANAKALRAFLHFDALRMFAPSRIEGYTEKGIPYVTKVQAASTAHVPGNVAINLIIKDLEDARDIFALIDKNSPEYKNEEEVILPYTFGFDYYVTKAALARVYLYAGANSKAYKEAMEVINSDANSVSNFEYNYDQETLLKLYKQEFAVNIDNDFVGDQAKYNINRDASYDVNDRRSGWLVNLGPPPMFPGWPSIPEFTLRKFELQEGYKTFISAIRITEMYLIAAEAGIDAEGLAAMNDFLTIRGLPGIEQDELQDELVEQYQKEFVGEGQLWFFHKRRNSDNIINWGRNFNFEMFGYDKSEAYTFPMPTDEIDFGKPIKTDKK